MLYQQFYKVSDSVGGQVLRCLLAAMGKFDSSVPSICCWFGCQKLKPLLDFRILNVYVKFNLFAPRIGPYNNKFGFENK